MKSRKINPTHIISYLPLIDHLIAQSLTISRTFTSSLHWTFIFATLNHQALSANFITMREHVVKGREGEKRLAFLQPSHLHAPRGSLRTWSAQE